MCLHLPAPIINYIIFFPQLCLSFQSSSTNPFSSISPFSETDQSSLCPFLEIHLNIIFPSVPFNSSYLYIPINSSADFMCICTVLCIYNFFSYEKGQSPSLQHVTVFGNQNPLLLHVKLQSNSYNFDIVGSEYENQFSLSSAIVKGEGIKL
jgi:hypothetical protein